MQAPTNMSNKEQYAELCAKNTALPVFGRPWWLDVVCSEWDVVLSRKGEIITGAWPYPIEKKAGVGLLRTPMLTPYSGPVVLVPRDVKPSKRDGYEYDIINGLLKQLPELAVWNLSLPPGLQQVGLLHRAGLDVGVRQTFRIDLTQTEEQLLANMSENLRRKLKGAAGELTIEESNNFVPQLHEYHMATLERKHKKSVATVPMMKKLAQVGEEHNSSAVYAAKNENEVATAIIWTVWDAESSYYLMGGQNPEFSNNGIAALLWHALLAAKKRGNRWFDLEGSMDGGVERFFRSFGGERSLYMVVSKNESLLWKLKQALR